MIVQQFEGIEWTSVDDHVPTASSFVLKAVCSVSGSSASSARGQSSGVSAMVSGAAPGSMAITRRTSFVQLLLAGPIDFEPELSLYDIDGALESGDYTSDASPVSAGSVSERRASQYCRRNIEQRSRDRTHGRGLVRWFAQDHFVIGDRCRSGSRTDSGDCRTSRPKCNCVTARGAATSESGERKRALRK
jgi:hypothetical protein